MIFILVTTCNPFCFYKFSLFLTQLNNSSLGRYISSDFQQTYDCLCVCERECTALYMLGIGRFSKMRNFLLHLVCVRVFFLCWLWSYCRHTISPENVHIFCSFDHSFNLNIKFTFPTPARTSWCKLWLITKKNLIRLQCVFEFQTKML